MSVSADDLVATYLRAIEEADAAAVIALFADDGVVHSPLYGTLQATEFYPGLFADTSESHLSLKSVMTGSAADGRATISFWFHFGWRLPSGAAAPFDCVDVATLDDQGKIAELHIVYDTVDVRPAFEAETGRSSGRPAAAGGDSGAANAP